MKKINFDNVGNAFVVGSFIGLIGQIIVSLVSFIEKDEANIINESLLIFALISAIYISRGGYFSIEKYAKYGSWIPLSGFIYGASYNTALSLANGDNPTKALIKGFWAVFKIFLPGFIASAAIGYLWG